MSSITALSVISSVLSVGSIGMSIQLFRTVRAYRDIERQLLSRQQEFGTISQQASAAELALDELHSTLSEATAQKQPRGEE